MEYDGPDLGYLSVTMDCLWDLYDATNDKDFLESNNKALDYIHFYSSFFRGNAGMHNSRNTDYIVPYGVARYLIEDDYKCSELANKTLYNVFHDINKPRHFFNPIDDRYWIHYIGHSVVRAARIIKENFNSNIPSSNFSGMKHNPLSGHVLEKNNDVGIRIIVSTKKGGIVSCFSNNSSAYYHNFGWIIKNAGKVFVKHWWSEKWKYDFDNGNYSIKSFFVSHSEKESTPLKHMILRILRNCY